MKGFLLISNFLYIMLFTIIKRTLSVQNATTYNIITLDSAVTLSTQTIKTLLTTPYSNFTVSNKTYINDEDIAVIKLDKDQSTKTSFISSNFALSDINILRDGQKLEPGKNLLYKVGDFPQILPSTRYTSNSSIIYSESKHYEKDYSLCEVSKGGFESISGSKSDIKTHNTTTFGQISFVLDNYEAGIKLFNNNHFNASEDLDDYINRMNQLYPNLTTEPVITVSNIIFKNIFVSNQINILGGHLIGLSENNEIFIWNITQHWVDEVGQQMLLSYYCKIFDSAGSKNFSKINKIGFYENMILIGYVGEGIEIFEIQDEALIDHEDSNSTDSTNTTDTSDTSDPSDTTDTTDSTGTADTNGDADPTDTTGATDNNDARLLNSNRKLDIILSNATTATNVTPILILSFDYLDFIINHKTIYYIEKGVGLRLFDLTTMEISQQLIIENSYLKRLDYLEYSLYDTSLYYIGVSAFNNPPANQEFFYEILASDEFNPSINRIYASSKKRRFDNFVSNLNSFSIFYDKESSDLVFITRGAPNVINIPSYVWSSFSLTSGYNPVQVLYSPDNMEITYMIQDGDELYYIKNLRLIDFSLSCKFEKKGQYDISLSYITSCADSDKSNEYNYCLYSAKTIYVVEESNSALVALLIILILILFAVIIIILLVKYGVICKKKIKSPYDNQRIGNTNQVYGDPHSDSNNNTNKVEMGEIEINVQHQQLDETQ